MNPLITPEQAIAIGFIFTRIIGIFLSFPLLNTGMIPLNIRIFIVIAFSFYIGSLMDIQISVENLSLFSITLNILKELLIGFLLGLLVNIFISAFSYAAEIISYFMGLTIVNVFDPTFGQISVLDRFFILIFYLIFFVSGSYKFIIGGLIMSFKFMPIYNFEFNHGIWEFLIQKSALLFLLGFQIAFPFALILFIINVSLALINRLIPQINVFIVGLPLQIFVGLAALSIGASTLVYLTISLLSRLSEDYIKVITHIGTGS